MLRHLPALSLLVARLIRDPRVGAADKALFAAALAYLFAPVDLVPDFLWPLGFVDDLYLLGLALGRLLVRAGPDRLLRHWPGDPRALGYFVESIDQVGRLLPRPVRASLDRRARRHRRRRRG
jgi:uncharacterized membrane protein YkvA (DUF1232 family)